MALVEIDETELVRLRTVDDAAKKITAHEKGRLLLEEAVAETFPDRAPPEVKQRKTQQAFEDRLLKLFDEKLGAFEKLETERQEAARRSRVESEWLAARNKLRAQGYTDDGIGAVEKLMEEHGIANHDAAAAYYEKINPPAPPDMTGGRSWNFFDEKTSIDLKPLFEGNEDGFLGPAIAAALQEVRGR